MAPTHASVGHPTAVLGLVIASLPGLDAMAPHVRMRRIEWHVMDKAEPMDHPCGAVVSLLRGDPSSVLCDLNLLEQRGMIPFFHTQDGVQTVRVQGLDVWGMRTQAVFGDDACEGG